MKVVLFFACAILVVLVFDTWLVLFYTRKTIEAIKRAGTVIKNWIWLPLIELFREHYGRTDDDAEA